MGDNRGAQRKMEIRATGEEYAFIYFGLRGGCRSPDVAVLQIPGSMISGHGWWEL